MRAEKRRDPGQRLTMVVCLFYFSAFLLLFLRDFVWQGLALAFAVPFTIFLSNRLLPKLFPADGLLLALAHFLCALGILVLYDTNPAYAYSQTVSYGVSVAAMFFCVWAVRIVRSRRIPVFFLAVLSLGLLAAPLVFGREIYGAKNWIFVGSVSVQPSEVVKLSLLVVLAYCMARRRFWSWFLFALGCLGLLMLQKDLGTALLYYSVGMLMFFASEGSVWILAAGTLGGAGAAVMGFRMFAHVKRRVAIWRNPWANYDGAGYQLVQGLMAIASGDLFGVGLGLGSPRTIPVYHTDFIYAVICEQFGMIFGLCVLAIYVALVWRGATIAMAARHSFHGLLALGATLMLGLQTFVIIGGVLKLIPLTGVTLPFISYGGSSLVSSMCLIGLIQGVASLNEDDLMEDTEIALGREEMGM